MKYFLFFGSELLSPKDHLQTIVQQGYCLIPLDPEAIGLAIQCGLNYKVIDDILNQNEIEATRKEATIVSRSWYTSEKSSFSTNGICWPELDQMALFWAWNDYLLILKILDKLDTPGSQFLMINETRKARPAVFAYPTSSSTIKDGIKLLIYHRLKGRVRKYSFPATSNTCWKKSIRAKLSLAKKYTKSVFQRTQNTTHYGRNPRGDQYARLIKDKILFIDLEDDFYRTKHLIDELKNNFSDEVILSPIHLFFPHNANKASKEVIAERTSTGVFSLPDTFSTDHSLSKQLMRAYRGVLQKESSPQIQSVLRTLSFQFEYYCRHRWPLLDGYYRFLVALFQNDPPRAVLVSNLDSAETQLPALAAEQFSIPTFAIPHGGVGRCQLNLQMARTIFYSSRLILDNSIEKTMQIADHNISRKKLVVAPGMLTEKNNVVEESEIDYHQHKLKVLVLTSTIGINQVVLPFVLPRAQMTALQGIAAIPNDLKGDVQILVRPRPGNIDLKFYQSLGLGNMLIPTESSLEENIRHCDLVVTLNNYQTSLSHAIRSFKPIVMFVTDRSLLTWEMMSYSNKYDELGETINSSEELWNILRAIRSDDSILRKMHAQTREFYDKYWSTERCHGIVDTILEQVDRGMH